MAEYLVRHGIFLGNYDMITQAGVISTLRIDYLFLHKAQNTWYTIVISILNVDVFGKKVSKSFFVQLNSDFYVQVFNFDGKELYDQSHNFLFERWKKG